MSFTLPTTGYGPEGAYRTKTLYLDPTDEVAVIECGEKDKCIEVMFTPGLVEVCRTHFDGMLLRWDGWGGDDAVRNAEPVDLYALGTRRRGWV